MNRSFTVFAGVASIALALVLSTQISTSAKISAPAKISTAAIQKQPHRSAKINAPAKISTGHNQKQPHRLAVKIDVNDPAVMSLALNDVSNAAQHYGEIGQKVEIEVVAFGPGLHMLRDGTSPVKARIQSMSETMPHLAFSACGNTRESMTRGEAKDIPLISQAKVVKAGVVRLMELQERGAIRDAVAGDVISFKSIPYAAPPVGTCAGMPQPPKPWAGDLA